MTPSDRSAGAEPTPRIPRIADRAALDDEARAVYDRIVESRGSLLRPFEILLYAPAMAGCIGELGHVVRSESGLADRDRELATLATGRAQGCDFVWTSHVDAAHAAGVSSDVIDRLERGATLDGRGGIIVAFVNELCTSSSVSDETYAAALSLLDTRGVVELSVTIGYYTMLSFVMRSADAC